MKRRCGCGHSKEAHRHYRRGTDCSWCPCPTYRPSIIQTILTPLVDRHG